MNNLKTFILYYDKHKGEVNGAFCALVVIIAVIVLGFVFAPVEMLLFGCVIAAFSFTCWLTNHIWKKIVKWASTP